MKKIFLLLAIIIPFGFGVQAQTQTKTKTKTKTTETHAVGVKKLTEEQKIEALIKYVAGLQGATFIRNGSEYSAKDAAEHLQMKRRKAGDKVKTARDFVDGLASESYLSGKPYQIRLKDGKTYASRDILLKELNRLEKLN